MTKEKENAFFLVISQRVAYFSFHTKIQRCANHQIIDDCRQRVDSNRCQILLYKLSNDDKLGNMEDFSSQKKIFYLYYFFIRVAE